MKRKFGKSWLVAGVLALGISAAVPSVTWARERTEAVRYNSLPREVRRTLDDERGNHEVLGIQYVDQDGKLFYRCTVALKNGERNIRIQPGGALLSVEDVREAEAPDFRKSKDDWYRIREERERARDEYWHREDERVRATARDPERVRWDDLPPRVQFALMRESYGVRPDYVVRYRDGNRVIWQTNIPDGPGRVHMVQVSTDGVLLNGAEFTSGGRPLPGDFRIRTVDFEDLPRSVRYTLDHDYRGARIPTITVTTRRGQRLYGVTVQEPRYDRYLVIDEDGEVLSDIKGRDYSGR